MSAGRKLRLDLAYDGTDFAGWQVQPGRRTVQGVLESALARLVGGERVVVRGAGRTDAGVHAEQQVAACTIATELDDARIEHALRGILPWDLRPLRIATVDDGFHARRALDKTYVYRVDVTRHGNPFLRRYALHHAQRLDPERIDEALDLLPGRRDWSGFTAAACTVENRTRTLTVARCERPTPGELRLVFTADGFLQHMVRNLVGTVLDVGGSRKPVQLIRRVLETGDRGLAGPTAAARGLCLVRVRYPGDGGASSTLA